MVCKLVTARRVLGEQVGWVDFTGYLPQIYAAEAYLLLDPQSVGVQMPSLAKP